MSFPDSLRGTAFVIHAHVIAREIDLTRALPLLPNEPTQASPRDGVLQYNPPPIEGVLDLGNSDDGRSSLPLPISSSVRFILFDFGVVVFVYEFTGSNEASLKDHVAWRARLYEHSYLKNDSAARAENLADLIRPALDDPRGTPSEAEDYTVCRFPVLPPKVQVGELPDGVRMQLAQLVRADTREFALRFVDETLSDDATWEYLAGELAIAGFDTLVAFGFNAPEILTIAAFAVASRAALSELDNRLDVAVDGIDDDTVARLGTANEVAQLILRLAAHREDIENTIKWLRDEEVEYIYRLIARALKLRKLSNTISERLELLKAAHETVEQREQEERNEMHLRRTVVLELSIVVLIILEVVLALFKIL